MPALTAERLREVLKYDPASGTFAWRMNIKGHQGACVAKAGSAAGSLMKIGYITITIDGVAYYAHRLAWLYIHGKMPSNEIDHINCDGFDNSLCNLREATRSQNCQNMRLLRRNKSGFKGVSWHVASNKWQAHCRALGDRRYLGLFDSLEDAYAAYCEAAKHSKEFARLK